MADCLAVMAAAMHPAEDGGTELLEEDDERELLDEVTELLLLTLEAALETDEAELTLEATLEELTLDVLDDDTELDEDELCAKTCVPRATDSTMADAAKSFFIRIRG